MAAGDKTDALSCGLSGAFLASVAGEHSVGPQSQMFAAVAGRKTLKKKVMAFLKNIGQSLQEAWLYCSFGWPFKIIRGQFGLRRSIAVSSRLSSNFSLRLSSLKLFSPSILAVVPMRCSPASNRTDISWRNQRKRLRLESHFHLRSKFLSPVSIGVSPRGSALFVSYSPQNRVNSPCHAQRLEKRYLSLLFLQP